MPYTLLQAASPLTNGFFMIAMLVVLVFFMIIPQRRKAKKQTAFMEGLRKGDQVVTASGILGRINKIDGEIVTLEVGTKNYIQVVRNAISKDMTDSVFAAEPAKS